MLVRAFHNLKVGLHKWVGFWSKKTDIFGKPDFQIFTRVALAILIIRILKGGLECHRQSAQKTESNFEKQVRAVTVHKSNPPDTSPTSKSNSNVWTQSSIKPVILAPDSVSYLFEVQNLISVLTFFISSEIPSFLKTLHSWPIQIKEEFGWGVCLKFLVCSFFNYILSFVSLLIL